MASDRKINRPIRDVAPPAKPPKRKLDLDALLTPEIKAKLRAEAEETLRKREMIEAEAEYLSQQTALIEKRNHPEVVEEERTITLELPPFMDRIVLDGFHYMHGGRYTVPKSKFDVMREITWNAFKHDDEVNNRRNSNAYRQERQLRMSAVTGDIVDNTGRPATKF